MPVGVVRKKKKVPVFFLLKTLNKKRGVCRFLTPDLATRARHRHTSTHRHKRKKRTTTINAHHHHHFVVGATDNRKFFFIIIHVVCGFWSSRESLRVLLWRTDEIQFFPKKREKSVSKNLRRVLCDLMRGFLNLSFAMKFFFFWKGEPQTREIEV